MNDLSNVNEDSILIFEYFTASGINEPTIISEACEIIRSLAIELKDFDTAVKAALDFAEKDKNTLVVVTADHETGGLTLPENKAPFKSRATIEFSTNHHTGCMVPVFAFGPGSEYFAGIQQNYEIGQKLINFIK